MVWRMGAVLALLLTATPTSVDGMLTKASQLVGDLKFKQAQALLDSVKASRDLERAQVIQLHELLARVAASQGFAEEATSHFTDLLEIEPAFALQGRASPKLTSPLFEAKAAVFKRGGSLTVSIEFAETKGRVTSAMLTVTGRREKLSSFAAEIEEDGVSRKTSVVPGAVTVNGKTVKVSIRAKDARGWVLVEQSFSRTAAVLEVKPVEPSPSSPPIVIREPAAAPVRSHAWRTAGLISLGTAAAATLTGVIFYSVGAGARTELDRAIQNRSNDVVPLTFARAEALNSTIIGAGDASTVAWLAAGLFAVAGAVFWLIDVFGSGS